MITLFSTLISFLTGGLPKLLDFFQDRQDKKHELQLAQMQLDQQFAVDPFESAGSSDGFKSAIGVDASAYI